jgi:hypothetical protein
VPNAIDELSPTYIGEKRIVLRLAVDSLNPRAFNAVNIECDYSACEPEGVVNPLELLITAPTESDFRRVLFNRSAPSLISFKPREGGRHVIRLGEVGHNRWFGYLELDIAGEPATANTVT